MRRSLLAFSLMLATGGAALMLAGGASAQPPSASRTAGQPIQLAQMNVTPERRSDERARRSAPPGAEQRLQRRAALCKEGSARMAGRLAYLETRLELTANQRAAFNRWREVRMAAASRRAQACATRTLRADRDTAQTQAARPGPVERMAQQEQRLRQRLSDLQAERPALAALYDSLTPEQRARFQPEAGSRRGMGRGPMRSHGRMMGGPAGGQPSAPTAR